jgi:hypothetical protein
MSKNTIQPKMRKTSSNKKKTKISGKKVIFEFQTPEESKKFSRLFLPLLKLNQIQISNDVHFKIINYSKTISEKQLYSGK